MGGHSGGYAWQACVLAQDLSVPLLLFIRDKKGVQLPLLVNKSLKHVVGKVASSYEVRGYVEGSQTSPICFSDPPEG